MLQVEQLSTSQMMRILESAKSQPAGGQTTSFEEVRKAARRITDAREREWFIDKLHEDLDLIRFDTSVVNGAVDITEEGIIAMHEDPAYREQIMKLIARGFSSAYYPRRVSMLINVGATLDEYRVDTWAAGEDTEFKLRSADSFYRRMGRSTVQAANEFDAGRDFQFRQQLMAVREEQERQAANVSDLTQKRRHMQAARMYEYSSFGGYDDMQMRAFEG